MNVFRRFIKGIVLKGETTSPSDNIEGSLSHNSATNKIETYIGGSLREVVNTTQSQTLTNKTIDADLNTIQDLQVTNLKAGVLDTDLSTVSALDDTIPSAKATKSYVDTTTGTVQTNLDAHINDTVDAHDASAISNVPAGTISATTVQAAINELDSDIQNIDYPVDSVNGQTGTVVLDTDDIAEGITNLYFTTERAQDAAGALATNSAKVSLTYNDALNTLTADIVAGSLVNADINAAAAIAYSKLNLTNSIVNVDIAAAAAIAYAKLNLSNSIVNADIAAGAAIAYSKLNLTNSIVNADIATAAAIDASKIADGSVSSTEFQYLSNVTSDIQNQINGKQATGNYITALTGDVTATGPGSVTATIANDAVTNAKLADMATQTFKGRTTAGTGDPEDLSSTQATAILNNFVGDAGAGGTKGLVPAPAAGDSASGKYLKADGTWATVAGTTKVALLEDAKASGTNGGTFTSGAYQTRVLNSEDDPDGIVTLSANQFTLGIGTYVITAFAPAFQVSSHKARLQNITDAVTVKMGQSAISSTGDNANTLSIIKTRFTLGAPKTYEIQHRCASTKATDGFGAATSFGDTEIYTIVEIIKIG